MGDREGRGCLGPRDLGGQRGAGRVLRSSLLSPPTTLSPLHAVPRACSWNALPPVFEWLDTLTPLASWFKYDLPRSRLPAPCTISHTRKHTCSTQIHKYTQTHTHAHAHTHTRFHLPAWHRHLRPHGVNYSSLSV